MSGSGWKRTARRVGRTLLVIVAVAVLLVVAQRVWVMSGDRSEVVGERLADGITYDRIVWSEPRPVVIHVATIDLNVEGVAIEVGAEVRDDGRVAARTTSEYVRRSGVTLGINGSFFHPFQEYPPWSAYPGDGDPVNSLGWLVIDGKVHGSAWGSATFSLIEDDTGDRPRFAVGELVEDADQAISGATVLVDDGVVGQFDSESNRPGGGGESYPRTALAADAERGLVYLVVVDGKQPGYSEGLLLAELAELLVDLGATHAVELDGGGSSTMVLGTDDGVRRLSRPINSRIPGRERIVATHVGVRTG